MSSGMFTPTNQVRLTNVNIVKLQTHGFRFEIACYPSKVINFREGVETDLSSVLQIERIFTNVSKGDLAPSSSLQTAFGTTSIPSICRIILQKGSLQSSGLERNVQHTRNVAAVVEMLSTKCVNPSTNLPYPPETLGDAVKRTGYVMKDDKKVKVMFLEVLKLMKERGVLDIERAKMRLRVTGGKDGEETRFVKGMDEGDGVWVEKEGEGECVFLVNPYAYRKVDDACKVNGWKVHIESTAVQGEGGGREIGGGDMGGGGGEREGYEKVQGLPQPPTRKTGGGKEGEEVGLGFDCLNIKGDPKPPVPGVGGKDGKVIGDSLDSEEEGYVNGRPMTTKERKKAGRKNKKQIRREKEREKEVKERVEKEMERRRVREERLRGEKGEEVGGGGEGEGRKETKKDKNISCNTCGGSFPDSTAHRKHFKSDWHRYNLQLKAQGCSVVDEEEFEREIQCDTLFFA
ncbi:hypothetical protein TrCOL_g7317 [Triparma columacea]|uniref:C2H2-type domain-containing protein n=1 Tax=Triparma columacea TaxID=722753 RepID=A0A9W7GK07_9STRA|nr:hypothetical protein TrCOL_g7317 [Triparma columacea]